MEERRRIGELRPSQLITTFGPGAVVDLPYVSAIVAGLDHWPKNRCEVIPEPRLRARLQVDEILTPPVSTSESHEATLPVFRFPTYLVCPTCRRLAHFSQFTADPERGVRYCYHPHLRDRERRPRARAFPVRFIVICPHGHIDDFPWVEYAHGGKRCRLGRDGVLTLVEGESGTLQDIRVRCSCQPDSYPGRPLSEAWSSNSKNVLGPCTGRRPWIDPEDREDCSAQPRVVLRGASNVYFPVVESALAIPPFANNPAYKAAEALRDFRDFLATATFDQFEQAWRWGLFTTHLANIDEKLPDLVTPATVWAAWQKLQTMKTGPDHDLLGPEYEALLSGDTADGKSDFEIQTQDVPINFREYIDRLVQVRRLREVRVLVGFTRYDPPADITTILSQDEEVQGNPWRAPLSRPQPRGRRWLPGVATLGEGIFFTLNMERVRKWERRVREAASAMEAAYRAYCRERRFKSPPPFPGARYVLLHTLAHALMRQLALSSGYSTTALRERIYCRVDPNHPENEMAGILIYTATPDSEGSLGGLVDQGQTEKFGATLWAALQEASFCSGDPLCAEHQPEFLGELADLNGAACHACMFASETSCERSNRFLDRSFLVPTVSRRDLAFFEDVL